MEKIQLYNSKAFLPNKLNFYRRNSLAQKIRRDLLRLIIYKPKLVKEIKSLQNQFQTLVKKDFKNVNEIISYDFKNIFKNYFYNEINTTKYKLHPSSQALKLIKLFENINNPSLSIYIHGSHADSFLTNYSDFDVSIFINNTQKELNFNKIRNDILLLNNFVKSIDLESHHSIFLNLKSDLDCYPESFLPLNVLQNSVISKMQELCVGTPRFSTDIAIDSFLRIYSSINSVALQKNYNSFYKIKFIISSYFMLIILNYEILNINYTDKKTIFSKLKLKKDNNNFINIFSLCSEIRENWPTQKCTFDFGISNYFVKEILKHSVYMLDEINNSTSLKKTLDIISDD